MSGLYTIEELSGGTRQTDEFHEVAMLERALVSDR